LLKFQLDHIFSYRNPRDRIVAVNTAPKVLSAAYDNSFHRIAPVDKALVVKILSWILRAPRPLRIDELCEALTVQKYDTNLERESMPAPSEVIECSQSLIVHESSGNVRFAHFTVEQFVAGLGRELPPPSHLAETCLTYLSFDVFETGPCHDTESLVYRLENYKFSGYAALYWGYHCRGEPERAPTIRDAIIKLLASENKRNSISQIEAYLSLKDQNMESFGASFPQGDSILHLLAKNGLAIICADLLQPQENR